MKNVKWLFGLCLVLCLTGCATVPPLYLNSRFDPHEIQKIALVPVVDARENTHKPLKLGKNGGVNYVKFHLGKRKYKDTLFLKDDVVVTKDELATPSVEWLQQFGSKEYDWVYFLAVEKLSKKHFILQTYASTSVHGYLYSKSTGELFWEGQADAKIVLGYLMYGVVDDFAIDKAVRRMMKSFPKK